jgi:hypothetical protein
LILILLGLVEIRKKNPYKYKKNEGLHPQGRDTDFILTLTEPTMMHA